MEKKTKYLVWHLEPYKGWAFREFNTLKEARAYFLVAINYSGHVLKKNEKKLTKEI